MKKVAVFASGGGSDFQSLIDSVNRGEIDAELLLISGKADNGAVQRAIRQNIPYFVFKKDEYPTVAMMYDELAALLQSLRVDLIVLAGYLTVLTPRFVQAFHRKIINIHPSLIPKFCGKGFYGLRVHEAVIDAQEKTSGCTVHYVDEGTDTGEIIEQIEVPVLESDTAETLQQRVLEQEHKLLPRVVKRLLEE